jgi:hypothetical protein
MKKILLIMLVFFTLIFAAIAADKNSNKTVSLSGMELHGNGTFCPNCRGDFPIGTRVIIGPATCDSGYHFVGWSGMGCEKYGNRECIIRIGKKKEIVRVHCDPNM